MIEGGDVWWHGLWWPGVWLCVVVCGRVYSCVVVCGVT